MSCFSSKVNRPILVMMFIGFFLALTLLVFAFVTNQSADVVIGHEAFNQKGINDDVSLANTLNMPKSVYTDGTKLYIADTYNHRVLIYNSVSTSDNAFADVVVGQPNMTSNSANQGASVAANTLNHPSSVYTDGTKLYIADHYNSRVLIYNSVPTVDNAFADVVVGQPNMTSNSHNQGGSVAANTLFQPSSVYTDGTKLYIADYLNNRVLIYNTVPTVNAAAADVVVGQPNMTSNDNNQGGSAAANTLHNPSSVYTADAKLYIADRTNQRVLIYNTVPTVNDTLADVVVGQPNMTSNAQNQGGSAAANTLRYPYSAYTDGTKLYIADTSNNRVLIYNNVPTMNNAPANVVVGQPNMTSDSGNQGGSTAADTLYYPRSVYTDGAKLYIADHYNHRVLIYNSVPTVNDAAADVVAGQPNMTSNSQNQGDGVAANTLFNPSSVYTDGMKLYIADRSNSRVLIYNTVPTVNNAPADVVVGQPNMTSNSSNQGGSVAAYTLYYPESVYMDGAKLYITDRLNNRVLIYNTVPTVNNAPADVVVGQPNMTSNSSNQGGSVAANTLSNPYSGYTDGTKLYIADQNNHRALIYNTVPTVNNALADVVVGQLNMTSDSENQGGSVAANTLGHPSSVYTTGTKLYIADSANNRVLIYNGVPAVNNVSADVVVGQPNMASDSENQGSSVAANTLSAPLSVYTSGTKLYIADYYNNRVLIYNSVPTSDNALANVVVGQPNMTSNSFNQGGGVAANTLFYPRSVYIDGTKLYIADCSNHRVLIYDDNPSTPTYTPTSTATQTATPTSTTTPTDTPTSTATPTITPTNTPTNTDTPTDTPTVFGTKTPTQTATPIYSPTETITSTPTYTITGTATMLFSQTITPTSTATPTISPTPTNTRIIPSPTRSPSPTMTMAVVNNLISQVSNYPNPFSPPYEKTNITYVLNQDADVEIGIYTYLGDCVKRFKFKAGEEGGQGTPIGQRNTISWDGRSGRGVLLGSGGYICRIIVKPRDNSRAVTQTRKIGIIRRK